MKYVKSSSTMRVIIRIHFILMPAISTVYRRGSKVRVPFGRGNRLRDAYVFEVSGEGEAGLEVETSKIKRVESVEKEVSLPEDLVSVCEWMRMRTSAAISTR